MVNEDLLELLVAADEATSLQPDLWSQRLRNQVSLVNAQIVSRALALRGIEPTIEAIESCELLEQCSVDRRAIYDIAAAQSSEGYRHEAFSLEAALDIAQALGCEVSISVNRAASETSFAGEAPHHRISRF